MNMYKYILNYSSIRSCQERITSLLKGCIAGSKNINEIANALQNEIYSLNFYIRIGDLFTLSNLNTNDFHVILIYIVQLSIKNQNAILLLSVIGLLINITDKSENFCKAISETNLPESLVAIIINDSFSNEIRFSTLDIIFNIIRFPKFRNIFQQKTSLIQLKKSLANLSNTNNARGKFVAMLILGFLTKENEENIIRVLLTSDVVECTIKYINNARFSTSKRYDGFNVWELLLGLEGLSRINSLRKIILDTKNVIVTLLEILSMDSQNTSEVQVVLSIIRNLTIDEDAQTLLKIQYKIESNVKPYLKNENSLIQNLAQEIISNFQRTCREGEEVPITYDIFISFSEDDKAIMVKIKDFLSTFLKIHVQNVQSRIPSQINESKFVLVGLSNSFYNDNSCKLSLEHAYNKNKHIIPLSLIYKFKPFGWMQNIINMENCIDFSEYSSIKKSLFELSQYLRRNGVNITQCFDAFENNRFQKIKIEYKTDTNNSKKEVINENKTLPDNFKEIMLELLAKFERERKNENALLLGEDQIKEPIVERFSESKDFSLWNMNEVSDWLCVNKLSDFSNKFNKFDGVMLKSLLKMRKTSPDRYYQQLESSLTLTFNEILKFDYALNKLEE